jgi:hypothetical protein
MMRLSYVSIWLVHIFTAVLHPTRNVALSFALSSTRKKAHDIHGEEFFILKRKLIDVTQSRQRQYRIRIRLQANNIDTSHYSDDSMFIDDELGEFELQTQNDILSSALQEIINQEGVEESMTHHDIDNEGMIEPYKNSLSFRRSRWKSKCYAMLQDLAKMVQHRDKRSIEKAQIVTQRLLEMRSDEFSGGDKPLIQAYNLWLHAISKLSPLEQRGQLAEQVLSEMKQHCRPTVISYTICMMANQDSPPDAERLLFELLERQQAFDTSLVITSSITTDAVLQAWAMQGTWEAAERARLILERLEQWQASSTHNVIEANSHTYSIVMNAYSKLGAVQQVEAILAKRIEDDLKFGKQMVDTVMYNVAIKAWAVSQDAQAGVRATALLEELEQVRKLQPDIITYNSVLSAWSRCTGNINAASQAERILQEMIVKSKANPEAPRPNTVSYNTVLHAWSKSLKPIAVERASAILEYMIVSQEPKPDIYSFTSVLNVLAKSKNPDKALKARELLDKLLLLAKARPDLEPSNIAFNTVLNACAFSATFDEITRKQALQIAVRTFSQLRSFEGDCRPDDITYGNLIKAIGNLLYDNKAKRQELAITVMRQCMQDGLVGEMVWQELPRCVTKKALLQLLPKKLHGNHAIVARELPYGWRRNVKVKMSRRSKEKGKLRKDKDDVVTPEAKRSFIKGPRKITESSWTSGKDL